MTEIFKDIKGYEGRYQASNRPVENRVKIERPLKEGVGNSGVVAMTRLIYLLHKLRIRRLYCVCGKQFFSGFNSMGGYLCPDWRCGYHELPDVSVRWFR